MYLKVDSIHDNINIFLYDYKYRNYTTFSSFWRVKHKEQTKQHTHNNFSLLRSLQKEDVSVGDAK